MVNDPNPKIFKNDDAAEKIFRYSARNVLVVGNC